ncbi:MAG TPA: nucleoside triphosphate pyrophosphatase [Gemmataceae bacterium]|nr:nucleoside triphosphate pyrophosphatase [Gemmataceae bacterium]
MKGLADMADPPPSRLTLASGSPARRELLERAGYAFDLLPANIDEPTGAGVTDIRAYVQQVAWLKAEAVAPRVAGGIVLAADTVGWLDGRVIGKPEDEADARRILRALAGREHELWTGVCLWRRPDDVQLAWQEMTVVSFKALTEAELDGYLATRQWQGCSGAYAIQERDDPFVRVVRGSLSNVIGLPLETLARVLPLLAAR